MTTPSTSKAFRVSVPISSQALARFQRYSDVTGVSIGKAISEWLDDTSEGLEPMTQVIKDMKSIPGQTTRGLNALATSLQISSEAVIQAAKAGPLHRVPSPGDVAAVRPSPPSSNTGGKVSKKVLQRGGKSA